MLDLLNVICVQDFHVHGMRTHAQQRKGLFFFVESIPLRYTTLKLDICAVVNHNKVLLLSSICAKCLLRDPQACGWSARPKPVVYIDETNKTSLWLTAVPMSILKEN
jgi:hypothetical protein